jgi:AraC-like DNA-binding protein
VTPPSDKVWTDRVRHALRPLLLREEPTSFERAAYLKMNVRTLSRRLAAEGTSFQKLLDEVRFAMARELLTDTDLEIRDIAKALSYSAHSPFVDALRRWASCLRIGGARLDPFWARRKAIPHAIALAAADVRNGST